jgi:2-oxoglutarate ferredoxin oxidoreductase subunit beta
VRRLTKSFTEALLKPGFSFVEAVAPCSTLYARRNRLGTGYDLMKFYHDNSHIELDSGTADLAIEYQKTIKVGRFVDIERPTWHELSDKQHLASLGEKYYRAAEMEAAQQEEKTHVQA